MGDRSRRGCLITFEGIEGSGKSTQIALLASALCQRGYRVLTTAEPGGTLLGEAIRKLVMDPAGSVPTPMTELLLYLADRAQHLEEVIRPALAEGQVTLCDRFSGSTLAYQGYGRSLDVELVARLDAEIRAGVTPALTILLDCSVEEGLRRAQGNDRLHREALEFHQRVRRAYHKLARDHASWVTIAATQPPPAVAQQVLEAVAIANVLPSCPSPRS